MAPLDGLDALALAAAFLFLGGLIKGILGIGLPLVSVPLLSYLLPVPTAIAVLCLPILTSNSYQVRQGDRFLPAFRRFWPLLASLAVGVTLGAQLLVSLDAKRLSLTLGVMVIVFAVLNLLSPRLVVPARLESRTGPLVGLGAGLLGGVSGFFGPPVIMYLVALKLPKDAFVSTVAMAFLSGSLPLYAVLLYHGVLGAAELRLSAAALLPVMAGVLLGQRLRRRVPAHLFSLLVLIALSLIGASLVRRGLTL